ncbi:YciK family oxidoreductase [Endothiovibrio diazotrophicus]
MPIPENYTPATDLLHQRVILITGAGDGIGRALAKGCAAVGATVILLGRTTAKLEAVYDEIEQAGHPQPAIFPMNLEGAAPKDYDDLAESIEGEFGRLDGLVHNAAELGRQMPLVQHDLETWFKVVQVNLNAPLLMTRALAPLLLKSEDASLLFVSDAVARKPRAYWGAYGVTKAACEAMMGALADELEQTVVRVNSIDPGAVRTRFRTRSYPGEVPTINPLPEEIIAPFLYLLGPDSKGINGQALDAQ